MAERYDAAIIGGGADGLTAAALLARSGARIIVLERHAEPGGRLLTREFHPGFHASPFTDGIAPIPADLFWSLDLAKHGAVSAPAAPPLALWPDRSAAIAGAAAARVLVDGDRRRRAALAHARTLERPARPNWWWPFGRNELSAWPAENWTHKSLADVLASVGGFEAALIAASALSGRATDPLAAGSALHLLAPLATDAWRGGLGSLGHAFAAAARDAGAEIACGLDVTDICCVKGRASALALADGTEIAARAVISTLDLKRTFLSLFQWSELDAAVVKQIGNFRIQGSTARILFALSARPKPAQGDWPDGLPRGPLHIAPDVEAMVVAQAQWRAGVLPERPPFALAFPSATDPGLAPAGAAVMTATVGCVPHTLFDGAWTHEKRDLLGNRVMAMIEEALPGTAASVVGVELLVPPDIEEQLGHTAGDLLGGEIAPDQMAAFRPFGTMKPPYTPVEGLYLAGPSAAAAPYASCAAGVIAASAVIADLAAGKLP